MAQSRPAAREQFTPYTRDVDSRSGDLRLSDWAPRVAYAALFVILLPLALILWARRLDALVSLPRLQSTAIGLSIMAVSAVLGLWATVAMWRRGGGLPASAFPPERLVTSGPYAIVAHPIYVAAVGMAVGASVTSGSEGGIWIVAPTLAMATFAWVRGFENALTRARFGSTAAPSLRVPDDASATPGAWARASVVVLVLVPWVVVYMGIDLLGPARDAVNTTISWERSLPVLTWTEIVYASAYALVALAPFIAATQRDLRRLSLDALWSMAFIFPLYLVTPFVAPPRPLPTEGLFLELARAERAFDTPATAFPAYHIVWALIAVRVYTARWSRTRWPLRALCAAIAASCVTTGMHGAVDVLAGIAMYLVVVHRERWWRAILHAGERIANSWREWRWGPVRVLNHGVYAAVGAAAGVAVQLSLAGPAMAWWSAALVMASIGGAAVWAQVVEGSPQLSRPFGYFGSAVGVIVVAWAASLAGVDAWLLFVSFGIGSTVTYAFGRLRCLVQGCCHGSATSGQGIIYSHPRSRVLRLASLGGVPLHPTPIYSLIWSLVVGAALLRLWSIGAALPFIAGCYFILVGLGRFIEEHHRGEPQTRVFAGLRLYQWLSIGFVLGGAVLTCVAGRPAPAAVGFDRDMLPVLAAVAALAFVAYGVDFPESRRRLARLA